MILPIVLLASTIAAAAPVEHVVNKRADDPSDTDILQYALTLEHLENAFYSGALSKFDVSAFQNDGFPSWVRDRFQQIADHEASHVQFLSTALGSSATQACNYSFPYTDPKSFAALAGVLEGVGTAAYLGAAKYITNKDYLTAAAAVLTTETRHTAWVKSAVMHDSAWSGAFDTPLDLNAVYSLAAPFIISCPSSNPSLPVKAFPALRVTSTPSPGKSVTFDFNSTSTGSNQMLYAAFFSGLDTLFAPLDSNKSATVPEKLVGTVYAVISTNGTVVSDDSTVAGPAILEFRLPEMARQTN
ncbi:related to stress response protein rds1p [Serendipita indica DSM 11827]|uniref:Related to stress response protein rds1p n=1 Tax=Serendipita indica (strain DSM 11827) TaxID=1109443 RepID=G4T9M4_SERID|nr:related to stress response protein rds1p [Serendipita indica DSM 11827]